LNQNNAFVDSLPASSFIVIAFPSAIVEASFADWGPCLDPSTSIIAVASTALKASIHVPFLIAFEQLYRDPFGPAESVMHQLVVDLQELVPAWAVPQQVVATLHHSCFLYNLF